LLSWRSGVISQASTTARFGGVAQRSLNDSCVMFDTCREEAPSSAMVALSVGLKKFMQILTMKMGWRFDDGDGLCSMYMRCSLRVC
jgi:hypothetical protein